MSNDVRYCPETGKELHRDVRPIEFSYKGLSITVDMPGWYGPEGTGSVHSGTDMKVSTRALNRLKAEHQKLLTPEEVRRIRKRLRLTQREAGAVIGGGPNAFQKYEAGDILVSKAIDSALRLLSKNPARLEELLEQEAA